VTPATIPDICKNCSEALPGQAVYCPACGQSVKEMARPWLEVVRELLTELFDFDGRMLVSLRLLLSRPGFLSHEYIHGRRASYTSPIRMYLVISLVFFFILPMILPETSVTSPSHELSVDLYSKGMFFLLPAFALILKIFYRRIFYLPHLIFSVYLFSAMYIVFAGMLSMETAADRYIPVMLLQVVLLAYMLIHAVVALRVNYAEGWLKSILKLFGILLLFLPVLGVVIEAASHRIS
jgi:hypothetical protein